MLTIRCSTDLDEWKKSPKKAGRWTVPCCRYFTCIFSMYFVLINCSCLKLLTGLIGCDYLVGSLTHSRDTHTCINDCLGLCFTRFIHVRGVFIRLVLKITEYQGNGSNLAQRWPYYRELAFTVVHNLGLSKGDRNREVTIRRGSPVLIYTPERTQVSSWIERRF